MRYWRKRTRVKYSRRLEVELVKDVSEIPTKKQEDRIWVAAVRGGLRLRVFDSDGKQAYDIQLMPSVSDEREIPNTGKNLIVAAYFDKVPCFRIFDANGVAMDVVGDA